MYGQGNGGFSLGLTTQVLGPWSDQFQLVAGVVVGGVRGPRTPAALSWVA
jgi:hypothetical protein